MEPSKEVPGSADHETRLALATGEVLKEVRRSPSHEHSVDGLPHCLVGGHSHVTVALIMLPFALITARLLAHFHAGHVQPFLTLFPLQGRSA